MGIEVAELRQLEALRPEWEALASIAGGGIFSSWHWQHLWCRFFGDDLLLRLLTIRDRGTLIGIWPLAQQADALTLIGGSDVSDYLDVIAIGGRERDVLGAGIAHLNRDSARRIDLRFVPAASPTTVELPIIAEAAGWRHTRHVDEVCPAVTLPHDWDGFLASLSKKDRHELRRKLRRLQEVGDLRYEVTGGVERLAEDTADFIRLHRLSRPEKAAFMDRSMEEFFAAVIATFRPRGELTIYFLAIDGRRVAATLCFEHGNELWVYNSGFDRDYSSLSVGLALKVFCIRDAIERGKDKVDFLRGREPYKYDLGARDVPTYRLLLEKP